MIRYALRCDRDHGFESWFASAEAFERLSDAGQLTCPDCGSAGVVKALMAPTVAQGRGVAASVPEDPRRAALAEMRRKVEESSEYVGLSFAAEARAIHEGEAPERSIYGEARLDEARRLVEDGVPVAPLPFLPKARAN